MPSKEYRLMVMVMLMKIVLMVLETVGALTHFDCL